MESFIARQTIFDTKNNVFAYELLFRSGFDNFVLERDEETRNNEKLEAGEKSHEDKLTSNVITEGFTTFDFDKLTNGKRAFINFTDQLILDEVAYALPKDLVTVEILETVKPTHEIIEAVKMLKINGYVVALDDFLFKDLDNPLIELVDIIKVDFMDCSEEEWGIIVREIRKKYPNIKFLAEKVETLEDYYKGLEFGYDYFQGYYFSKPEIVRSKGIPDNKLNQVRILGEINKKDVGFDELENIFKTDVSLSFKILKFINSSFFGLRNEIKSIKRALVLLGIFEIKKWVSIVSLNNLKSEKPDELIVTSLIRATFFEKLAILTGNNNKIQEAFILGMFTVIDALLDKPMDEILDEFPIDKEIKQILINRQNKNYNEEKDNNIFFLELVNILDSLERAEWDKLKLACNSLNLKEDDVSSLYKKSLETADQIYNLQ